MWTVNCRYAVDPGYALLSSQSNCLYVAALTERELIQTGTSAPIWAAVLGWRDALTGLLRAALPATGPGAELDCEAWADHVVVTFEGAFILWRVREGNGYMKAQLAALRAATAAIAAVSPRGNTDLEGPGGRDLDGRRAGPVDGACVRRCRSPRAQHYLVSESLAATSVEESGTTATSSWDRCLAQHLRGAVDLSLAISRAGATRMRLTLTPVPAFGDR